MITIGNKEFRNIQEQVEKNKNDILYILEEEGVLNEFGIRVTEQVENIEDLPTVAEYKEDHTGWEYGDCIAVGDEEPYELYVLTRANGTHPNDYWFDLGVFPLPGPQGETGEDGFSPQVSISPIDGGTRVSITDSEGTNTFDIIDGSNGTDGADGKSVLYYNNNLSTTIGAYTNITLPNAKVGDIVIGLNGILGNVTSISDGVTIQTQTSIVGPRGETGATGATGPDGRSVWFHSLNSLPNKTLTFTKSGEFSNAQVGDVVVYSSNTTGGDAPYYNSISLIGKIIAIDTINNTITAKTTSNIETSRYFYWQDTLTEYDYNWSTNRWINASNEALRYLTNISQSIYPQPSSIYTDFCLSRDGYLCLVYMPVDNNGDYYPYERQSGDPYFPYEGYTVLIKPLFSMRGIQGAQGPQGQAGSPGQAATITVGTVTTGAAGTSASITNSGTSSAAVFNFTIPKGDTGAAGQDGTTPSITAAATVDSNIGTPSVVVTKTGTDAEPTFTFAFSNIKGEPGLTTIGIQTVNSLPATGTEGVIYLVPKTTSQTNNTYDEYIYTNNSWEKIGDTQIDLTNYIQKSSTSGLVKNDGTIDTNTYALASVLNDYVTTTSLGTTLSDYVLSSALSTVATSGSYADLSNTPDLSIYAESSDLATVATTGDYDDLLDTPDLSIYAESADLATVATSGDYDDLDNKPDLSVYAESVDLATVATTGDYDDLLNKPTIPTVSYPVTDVQVNNTSVLDGTVAKITMPTLAAVATSGSYNDLINRPTIPTDTVVIEVSDQTTTGTLSAAELTQMTTDPTKTMFKRGTVYYSLAGIGSTYYRYSMTSGFTSAIISYFIIINKNNGNWEYDYKQQNIISTYVSDVQVDGSSVVNNGVASITMPTYTQVQANWNELDSTAASYIQNKPTIPNTTYMVTTNTDQTITGLKTFETDYGIVIRPTHSYMPPSMTFVNSLDTTKSAKIFVNGSTYGYLLPSMYNATAEKTIATTDQIITSYNDLTDKPTIPDGFTLLELTNASTIGTLTAEQLTAITANPEKFILKRGTEYYWLVSNSTYVLSYSAIYESTNDITYYHIYINKTSGSWEYAAHTITKPVDFTIIEISGGSGILSSGDLAKITAHPEKVIILRSNSYFMLSTYDNTTYKYCAARNTTSAIQAFTIAITKSTGAWSYSYKTSLTSTDVDTAINNAIYYKTGDTYGNTYFDTYAGFITSSSKTIAFSVKTPKMLTNVNKVIVNKLNCMFRGISGNTGGSNYVDYATATGFTVTATITNENTIYFTIAATTAYSGATNNTPIQVIFPANGMDIEFSYQAS